VGADGSASGAARRTGLLPNLRRIRTYVRPYRRLMGLMVAAAMLSELAPVAVPLLVRRIIDGPIHDGDKGALIPLVLLVLLLGLAEAAMIFTRRWVMTRSALGIETDMRDHLYAHLQRLQVAFHDRWQTGQLLSRVSSDLATVRRFLGFGLVFLIVNATMFVVVEVLLLFTYWPLGLLVLASAAPLTYGSLRFERRYAAQARLVQDLNGELATEGEEAAGGIRTIKAFGRRRLALDRFMRGAGTLRREELAKIRILALFWALIEVHPQLVLTAIVLIGAAAVAHGALTLGGLVAFVSLFLLLVWPIESLGWILAQAQEADTAAQRVYEVLDTPPSIVDRPGATALAGVEGRLRFDGVTFAYPGAAEPVLRDVTLEIAPGETVALVGATGSGKTTLTALVPRLYDVTGGAVTIDGVDVRDIPLDNLRTIAATAFEDPTLFSASAWENLTLGRPGSTEAEVTEAIEIAQADFVYDLPWGLRTRIGEQGLTLSGGQRQRLALARAVLGRPRVLVLDDPLSALDVHTEALVEEALRRVLAHTTALVVAHRPSTVLLADRVALLDGGRIAALGTHSELLATVPRYRDLLASESELLAEEVS
jgi:ATP-binding cassette, subfamily B, bacterial